MTQLKKILVGIDPRQPRPDKFSPPTVEAVKQAIWLAERMKAEITFLSVLDPPEDDELYTLLGEAERMAASAEAACQARLTGLIEQAQHRGVRAAGKIAYGTGWIELTREATAAGDDLVIVGTRNRGLFRRALFGSTAMQLLQNCPLPVWVTKPEHYLMPAKLLVASDFSPISDKALRLAVGIGSSCRAEMHLIHVLKQPFAQLCDTGEPETCGEEGRHQRDLVNAKSLLKKQIERVLADTGSADITIAEDTAVADDAIEKYVETHQVDLLVIGSNARRGLAGVFAGNTAEWLLPTVHCSLLVVKPDGFVCPVCLASCHAEEPVALR